MGTLFHTVNGIQRISEPLDFFIIIVITQEHGHVNLAQGQLLNCTEQIETH